MSAVDPNSITPEMLGTVLVEIFCPNTEVIKKATEVLKKYFKLPTCIGPFLTHITINPDVRVRLLACVCLKQKIIAHWEAQEISFRETIKSTLINTFMTETEPKVRENISYVIGTLSSLLVPNGKWPDLVPFIVSKCQSENPVSVEQGMILLCAVCENLGSALEDYFSTILEILNKLIFVENENIQILAIKTIQEIMLANIKVTSLAKIVVLIPQILQTVGVVKSNTTILQELFDNMMELLELQNIIAPHLPGLINTAIAIATNTNNNSELRIVVLTFLETAVVLCSRTIKKDQSLIISIVEATFVICKEDSECYDDEDNEMTPIDAALDLIEQYSFKFTNKVLYPLLMSGCETYLKSSNPLERKAALLVLGTASKGIENVLKKNLESVLNVVLQCSRDTDVRVQEACIMALSFLVDNLSPEILKYQGKIIPLLATEIETKSNKVRLRAFYALQNFCENVQQSKLIPYIKLLLHSLVTYLNDPKLYL